MIDGNGQLYAGGAFSQINNTTDVGAGHYLLAQCCLDDNDETQCHDFFGDATRSADGVINSISIGSILSVA